MRAEKPEGRPEGRPEAGDGSEVTVVGSDKGRSGEGGGASVRLGSETGLTDAAAVGIEIAIIRRIAFFASQSVPVLACRSGWLWDHP